MGPDDTVCTCNDVTRAMIIDAVRNDARTLEEVQEAAGAGEVRDACPDDTQAVTDEIASE